MDLREAIAALPQPYSVALELDDAGRSADEVAAALGVAVEAVPVVLRLGREKLARLLVDADDGLASGTPPSGGPTPRRGPTGEG